MIILTRITAVLLAAATISSSTVLKSPSNTKDGNFELLILHNNDMHARFEQTSQLSGACTIADREAGKCYGGFPRVAHVVKEARRKAASGEGPPVLYLNAGDTYTGTAWFTIYKWKIAAEFINALQPDAVSLGNNDLENGSAELSPFLDSLNTTILATNVILSNPVKSSKLVSSAIYLLGETKVGLVAYLTPEMVDSNGAIEYIDEVIALKEEVSKLQAQDINIIIALGHADLEKDLEVAREVEGIDLIIAGHKNTFYWNGTTADAQILNEAIVVTQESGKNVPIISSYAYNKYLGKVNIEFETNGEITSYHVEPVVLDERIPQDPAAVDIENKLGSEFVSRSEELVGQTAVVLDGETCKIAECNLGNLITDAMIYYYAVNFEGERWTDAPIAMLPGGDIAASISPQNRPASVTRGDLMAVLPIESHLVAITMNGTVLEKLLEHSVAEYSLVNPTGNLLQFSGIRIAYDMNKPVGSRIETAVVRCWDCFVPEFYSIDDWRSYKILMPAGLANGAYGYSMLEGLSKENIVYDELTCTMEYIALRSPVYPEVAERIHINNFQEEAEEEVEEDINEPEVAPEEEEDVNGPEMSPEEEDINEPELPPEEEDINEPELPPEEEEGNEPDMSPEEEDINEPELPPEEEDINEPEVPPEEEEGNGPELPPEEVEGSPQPDAASSLYSTIPILIITLITLVVS